MILDSLLRIKSFDSLPRVKLSDSLPHVKPLGKPIKTIYYKTSKRVKMKATRADIPEKFYWDGLRLWGVYEGLSYMARGKINKRHFKGSPEEKGLEPLSEFKNLSSVISREIAEIKYPEYFI